MELYMRNEPNILLGLCAFQLSLMTVRLPLWTILFLCSSPTLQLLEIRIELDALILCFHRDDSRPHSYVEACLPSLNSVVNFS